MDSRCTPRTVWNETGVRRLLVPCGIRSVLTAWIIIRASRTWQVSQGLLVEEDRVLVRECLAGNAVSMRALVERFQDGVFGLCYRMLRHREDAEDVTQEVFLRAFRSLAGWDRERPLKPWLLAIAANRCKTWLQQRSRRPVTAELSDAPSRGEHDRESVDLREEIALIVQSLRDDYRLCFVLFYENELDLTRVAEILDRPEGTVKTWLHRARHQIAEGLRRRGIGPEETCELRRI